MLGSACFAVLFGAVASAQAAPRSSKIGDALERVYAKRMAERSGTASQSSDSREMMRERLGRKIVRADGYVAIDAVAAGETSALEDALRTAGATNLTTSGRVVSALVPVDSLSALRSNSALKFARPVLAKTNAGLTTAQGDRSMQADAARQRFGVSGAGTTVGVLSDSFSCTTGTLAGGPWTSTAQDIANGDLPSKVTILSDLASGCTDEGRGMAQLVHDSAPGAAISFHTAFNGQADFAQGILDLAKAGADVIVDDVIYFAEPMFQDGIIAQAADEVARLGVPYYSSAGNDARASYESRFRAANGAPGGLSGLWHDFNAGAGTDFTQTVTLSAPASVGGGFFQSDTLLSFQWDEPNFSVSGGAGSRSDLDLVMFDATSGAPVPDCFVDLSPEGFCYFLDQDGTVGGDAIELVELVYFGTDPSPKSPQIGFRVTQGPAPTYVKYVAFDFLGAFSQAEYDTQSSTAYGHNNAKRAEAVGAAAFFLTEEWAGDPSVRFPRTCSPACLNDFSSAGGTPVFIKTDGARYRTPKLRLKPGITAPDGSNTSFFFRDTSRDDDDGDGVFQSGEPGEFPNFFGTSAAAPSAASIAALMIDAENSEILRADGKFRMCRPRAFGARAGGQNRIVDADGVDSAIGSGWLLGPCDRAEPKTIYAAMRKTAENMKERASLADGSTIQTFTEFKGGFDFDSGFGFIDAKAALRRFISKDRDGDDDYGRDYDERD